MNEEGSKREGVYDNPSENRNILLVHKTGEGVIKVRWVAWYDYRTVVEQLGVEYIIDACEGHRVTPETNLKKAYENEAERITKQLATLHNKMSKLKIQNELLVGALQEVERKLARGNDANNS